MSEALTVPEAGTQQIDMTGWGDKLRTVQILTDAGVVNVNTNLVGTRDGRLTVVVEVEPNGYGSAGGPWEPDVVRWGARRIDVTLTKGG